MSLLPRSMNQSSPIEPAESPSPHYAYDLEKQMQGVMDAQESGTLQAMNLTIDHVALFNEKGQGWWVVTTRGDDRPNSFFEGHCTEYIGQLKSGDMIITIAGKYSRPDIFDGKILNCSGLILDSYGMVLYKSPGYIDHR